MMTSYNWCSIIILLQTILFPTTNQCNFFNTTQLALFTSYFVNINYLKVVIVYQDTLEYYSYVEQFVIEWSEEVSIPVLLENYPLTYEESYFDYNELFSWSGEKFNLRPTQNLNQIGYDLKNRPEYLVRDESNFGVFVIVENIEILDNYAFGIPRRPFHTPKGIYCIAILEESTEEWKNILENLLERIWRDYKILRLIVFSTCEDNIIFTYEPFNRKNSSFVEEANNTKAWGNFVEMEFVENLYKIDKLYPLLFNGYPLLSVMFYRFPTTQPWNIFPDSFVNSFYADTKDIITEYGGFDTILYGNIAKALNFTPILTKELGSVGFGYKQENNTYTGSIGDVIYSSADISINPRFLMDYESQDIEFLYPVLFDKFCIIAPKAPLIPQSMAIFKCYAPSVWALLVVHIFTFGFLWKLMKRHNPNQNNQVMNENSWVDNIIEMSVVITSGSVNLLSNRTVERLFIIAVSIGGLILTSVFQGSLTTSYTTKTYYKDIHSLQELDDSGLVISAFSRSLRNIFGENQSALITSLSKKLRIPVTEAVNKTAYKRNTCCVERISDFALVSEVYTTPDGTKLLYRVDECPRFYSLSYIVRKGWCFADKFNDVILKLSQGGFLTKWYITARDSLILQDRKRKLKHISKRVRSFSLNDMQTSFFILFAGNILGIFVFIFEIYYVKKRISRNRENKRD